MNLLNLPLITTIDPAGAEKSRRTLPGTLAALVAGDIGDFPRLRPHQRHVWHALLVQLATLALATTGRQDLPENEDDWRALLLALTPDDADGAAWSLVSPPDRPAFLQAPVPGGNLADFKPVATPDELDMLIMSKNHDLKAGALPADDAELWLYALVSLQTQEGFLGAGNYGISRMNGGFASRPAVSVTPETTAAQFQRDCRAALGKRAELANANGYKSTGGIGLVWLVPWDGNQSLALDKLDLFYVEICRRIRLMRQGASLVAMAVSTKVPRLQAKELKGRTGDLWTPRVVEKDGAKAFTADSRGWTYQQMVRLLFPRQSKKGDTIEKAPLQEVLPTDAGADLTVLARVVVRGQGKTEGYHERRVPISKFLRGFGTAKATDLAADIAHDRVGDAGTFARQVVFPAVMAVYAGAPRKDAGERARDDDTTKARAGNATARFDTLLDPHFFDDLGEEIGVMDDAEARHLVRARWISARLRDIGRAVLEEAIANAPDAAARHWRVRVTARDVFEASFAKQFGDRLREAGVWIDKDKEEANG